MNPCYPLPLPAWHTLEDVRTKETLMRQRIFSRARSATAILIFATSTTLLAQQAPETLHLAGLKQPVDILVDHWGVPHIYAGNEADLFFAQGFNVARDRLFQIDLWRRRGLGELAEVFGPAYVEEDKATRLFLYRGDMKKEWEVYGPATEQMFQRFVAGINGYIDWLDEHPEQMP